MSEFSLMLPPTLFSKFYQLAGFGNFFWSNRHIMNHCDNNPDSMDVQSLNKNGVKAAAAFSQS